MLSKIATIFTAFAMVSGQAPQFTPGANPGTNPGTNPGAPPASVPPEVPPAAPGTTTTVPPNQGTSTTAPPIYVPSTTYPAVSSTTTTSATTTAAPIPLNAPGMPASTPGFVYGMYGQECRAGPMVPDLTCRLPSYAVNEPGNGVTIATSGPAGNTKCEAGYSCCQCAKIECGSYSANGFNFCSQLTIGDNAATGVQDISVIGNGMIDTPNFGAYVACDGYKACADSVITASYTRVMSCSSDYSCANAIIRILAIDTFELVCSGRDSCAGAIIELLFPPASAGNRCFQKTFGQALQAEHIKCDGPGSCKNTKIILNGDVACQRQVKASNVGCNAMQSCLGTKFTGVMGDWEYQEFDCAPGACMGCTYDNPGAPNQPCDPNLAGNQFGGFQPGLTPGQNVPLLPGQILI